jgi:hypothetical protein
MAGHLGHLIDVLVLVLRGCAHGRVSHDTHDREQVFGRPIHFSSKAAVNVADSNDETKKCDAGTLSPTQNVRVARNFIHDNQNWDGGGYAVVTGTGAYPFIMGNVFLRNRHSVSGDGKALTGYSAWLNIVLSDSPDYSAIGHGHQQDFDMHGTEPSPHHTGGIAGSDVEIARNLFLGIDRPNYDLRGNPCALEQFHNNVVRQSQALTRFDWAVSRDGTGNWTPLRSIAASTPGQPLAVSTTSPEQIF